MSSSKTTLTGAELAERVAQLCQEARAGLADGSVDKFSDESVQQMLTAAVKLYVAKREAGSELSPFADDSVTATDVSITAIGMLKAADMQIFELSLWSGFGSI